MKKILLLSFLGLIGYMCCCAQVVEPDFVGEVNLINEDEVIQLDKEYAQIKTKAGASLYLTGIGSVKSRINVSGVSANARAQKDSEFVLIVKAVDNLSDPLTVVNIFKFEINKKARRALLSSVNTFKGQSNNDLDFVDFTAKKYGESSYEITLKNAEAGEYGVIVKNPNNLDEKSLVIACFGLD